MSLMFEDRYPLLFGLILWTCSKRNAFLETNTSWVSCSGGYTGTSRRNNDKNPTALKEILADGRSRYYIANDGVSSGREEGEKCQLQGGQTDLRLTAYSHKTCTPPDHKYLWKKGKQKIPHSCCPSRSLHDKISQFHWVNQCFLRAKTPALKLDCISLQTPSEHSWKNGCEMIHTAPHISAKNTFQVI